MKITQERAKQLFSYRGGKLFWRIKTSSKTHIGNVVGSHNGHGYFQVNVDGNCYRLHRIIWLWHYGYFPENGVDHINRDKLDNRIENLREVSQICNLRNTNNPCDNKSGVKGVIWEKTRKKWMAYIRVNNRMTNIFRSSSFIEAVCHRLAAEQCLGWEGCDSSSPAYKCIKYPIKDYPEWSAINENK